MSGNDFVKITADFLTDTPGAVLIEDADGHEYWLPKSTIRFDGEFDSLRRGQSIQLEVQEWIATKHGLI